MSALETIAGIIASKALSKGEQRPAFVEGWGECEILLERAGLKLASSQWRELASQLTETSPEFQFQHFCGFTAAMALEEMMEEAE